MRTYCSGRGNKSQTRRVGYDVVIACRVDLALWNDLDSVTGPTFGSHCIKVI